MSLPLNKLQSPLFECVIPSTKTTVQFRPYLVKEEKVLLIAKESGDAKQIYNAIVQIVSNCLIGQIDVQDLPSVDLEYLFLKIHSKSVSNISRMSYKDTDDGKVYSFDVDLDTIEVIETEGHTNKIAINDELGLIMKYPSVRIVDKIDAASDTDLAFDLTVNCIDSVFDSEMVYVFAENSSKEQVEFVENLSIEVYEKIQEFFSTIPKLEHTLSYTNKNGDIKKIVLRGLTDFFSWG